MKARQAFRKIKIKEQTMTKYYHVAEKWDGEALESLYSQHGDDAYDLFAERWPEGINLAYEHAGRIHMYYTIKEAESHKRELGGEILEISLDDDAKDEISFMIDDLEFDHPMACGSIPSEYIKKMEG